MKREYQKENVVTKCPLRAFSKEKLSCESLNIVSHLHLIENGIAHTGNIQSLVSVAILSNCVISTFNSSELCHPLGPHRCPQIA